MKISTLKVVTAFAVAVTGIATSSASAQEASVGGGISTLGPVIEGSYRVQPKFGFRAAAIGLGISRSDTQDVDKYTVDGTVKLSNFGAMADWYPLSGKWHVSGGLFFSSDIIKGTFSGSGPSFQGSLGFDKKTAPLITTGWDWDVAKKVRIGLQAGAVISSLKVKTDSTDPTVRADVASTNDELGKVKAFPFVSATIGYVF